MAVGFALLAALGFGLSDFLGGLLSKTRSVWMVATASRLTAASASAVIALLTPGDPQLADFGWAVAAGVGGAVGVSFLYRGLSRARMGVVAPLSGTGAALVPVIVGIASGEEPSLLAWIGIVAAFPAIYAIPQADTDDASAQHARDRSGANDGVLAGLGFGALYALVNQLDQHAGFLPLALLHLVAAVIIGMIATALRQSWIPRGPGLGPVFTFGLLGAAALLFFQLASQQGLLTIVSVIAALYPAATIIMAALVLREKLGTRQSLGLALAASAIVLVSIG